MPDDPGSTPQTAITPTKGDISIGRYGAAGHILYRGSAQEGQYVRFGENVYPIRTGNWGKELFDPGGGIVQAHTPRDYNSGGYSGHTSTSSTTNINSIYGNTTADGQTAYISTSTGANRGTAATLGSAALPVMPNQTSIIILGAQNSPTNAKEFFGMAKQPYLQVYQQEAPKLVKSGFDFDKTMGLSPPVLPSSRNKYSFYGSTTYAQTAGEQFSLGGYRAGKDFDVLSLVASPTDRWNIQGLAPQIVSVKEKNASYGTPTIKLGFFDKTVATAKSDLKQIGGNLFDNTQDTPMTPVYKFFKGGADKLADELSKTEKKLDILNQARNDITAQNYVPDFWMADEKAGRIYLNSSNAKEIRNIPNFDRSFNWFSTGGEASSALRYGLSQRSLAYAKNPLLNFKLDVGIIGGNEMKVVDYYSLGFYRFGEGVFEPLSTKSGLVKTYAAGYAVGEGLNLLKFGGGALQLVTEDQPLFQRTAGAGINKGLNWLATTAGVLYGGEKVNEAYTSPDRGGSARVAGNVFTEFGAMELGRTFTEAPNRKIFGGYASNVLLKRGIEYVPAEALSKPEALMMPRRTGFVTSMAELEGGSQGLLLAGGTTPKERIQDVFTVLSRPSTGNPTVTQMNTMNTFPLAWVEGRGLFDGAGFKPLPPEASTPAGALKFIQGEKATIFQFETSERFIDPMSATGMTSRTQYSYSRQLFDALPGRKVNADVFPYKEIPRYEISAWLTTSKAKSTIWENQLFHFRSGEKLGDKFSVTGSTSESELMSFAYGAAPRFSRIIDYGTAYRYSLFGELFRPELRLERGVRAGTINLMPEAYGKLPYEAGNYYMQTEDSAAFIAQKMLKGGGEAEVGLAKGTEISAKSGYKKFTTIGGYPVPIIEQRVTGARKSFPFFVTDLSTGRGGAFPSSEVPSPDKLMFSDRYVRARNFKTFDNQKIPEDFTNTKTDTVPRLSKEADYPVSVGSELGIGRYGRAFFRSAGQPSRSSTSGRSSYFASLGSIGSSGSRSSSTSIGYSETYSTSSSSSSGGRYSYGSGSYSFSSSSGSSSSSSASSSTSSGSSSGGSYSSSSTSTSSFPSLPQFPNFSYKTKRKKSFFPSKSYKLRLQFGSPNFFISNTASPSATSTTPRRNEALVKEFKYSRRIGTDYFKTSEERRKPSLGKKFGFRL